MSNQQSVRLGRYQIEAHLGAGTYAEVYRAMDTLLKRPVALKVLKPGFMSDGDAFARFTQEAQVAAGLVHPRIAWVWDLGEAEGRYFIAMRYVEGCSLDALIQEQGQLDQATALKIAAEVGEALVFAHSLGLVHRDVKPQNILLNPKEGAVLTDFGLVRAVEAGGSRMTHTGAMLGTPQYMPPEVWMGQAATAAADQYALACVLAEMLSGASPFAAPTPVAVMKRVFEPVVLPQGLPLRLAQGLSKALAKEPYDRFESVAALCEAWVEVPKVNQTVRQTMETKKADRMKIRLAEGVEMEFCRVPAGEFLMGSAPTIDSDVFSDEKPQQTIYLDEYWIGRYPVTNRQYAVYVKETRVAAPAHWEKGLVPVRLAEHPVVNVSWTNASGFCKWLSEKSGARIMLPTEAQWEKAARGDDGRLYPWGNTHPTTDLANYGEKYKQTTLVGQFSPRGDSIYGCADMVGNVWEWCADWYRPDQYLNMPARNPSGPPDGQGKVMRGSSWGNNGNYLRAAYRSWNDPTYRHSVLGFRCAR